MTCAIDRGPLKLASLFADGYSALHIVVSRDHDGQRCRTRVGNGTASNKTVLCAPGRPQEGRGVDVPTAAAQRKCRGPQRCTAVTAIACCQQPEWSHACVYRADGVTPLHIAIKKGSLLALKYTRMVSVTNIPPPPPPPTAIYAHVCCQCWLIVCVNTRHCCCALLPECKCPRPAQPDTEELNSVYRLSSPHTQTSLPRAPSRCAQAMTKCRPFS